MDKKDIIRSSFVLLVGMLIGYLIFGYATNRNTNRNNEICGTFKCGYNTSTKLYEFIHFSLGIEKYFPKREECMDYCITNLKTDSVLRRELTGLFNALKKY